MNSQVVNMEGKHDCAAACLAMVLGLKTASAAYPMLGYDPSKCGTMLGTFDAEILHLLHIMGKQTVMYMSRESVEESHSLQHGSLSDRHNLKSKAELQCMLNGSQSGCFMVAVPSLNYSGGSHFVFSKRGEIHDPSKSEKRYIGTAKSLPVLCVIHILD